MLDTGEGEIRIPASLFQDRTGKNIGKVSLDLPQAPAKGGEVDWNYYIDTRTNEYVLKNTAPLNNGSFVNIEFTYYTNSMAVKDGFDKGGFSASFSNSNESALVTSNELSVNVDTYISQPTGNRKSLNTTDGMQSYYYSWQPSWGEEPEDDGHEYGYVCWSIYYTYTGGTQPVTIYLDDPDDPENGIETVGYYTSQYDTKLKRTFDNDTDTITLRTANTSEYATSPQGYSYV